MEGICLEYMNANRSTLGFQDVEALNQSQEDSTDLMNLKGNTTL